ncbi:MAG: hypothetical protein AB7E36_07770 [Salinivirgaceae bacterium]
MKNILTEIKVKCLILSLLIINVFQLRAQILDDSACPFPTETNLSKLSIELFLTDINYEEKRITSGTNNISISEVFAIDNEEECANLKNIVQSNPMYNQIDQVTDLRKYFYKTNDFYFIFWQPRKLSLGPKRLFLVIKKDYSKIYEFYL